MVGLLICDLGTGMWAAQDILPSLYERQRTGKGRTGSFEGELTYLYSDGSSSPGGPSGREKGAGT
jgi:hypothetical protein